MKTLTPGFKQSDKVIKGLSEVKDKNGCVVRALAVACEVPYIDAMKFATDYLDRKPMKGVQGRPNFQKCEKEGIKLNGFGFTEVGQTSYTFKGERIRFSHKTLLHNKKGYSALRKMTAETFRTQNPKGTFLILVRRHAFIVKDGIVIDNPEYGTQLNTGLRGERRPILAAFEVSK